MLLNKFNVPYITPSEFLWLGDWNIGEIYNFDDGDYYAIQFLDPLFCTKDILREAIPFDIREKIKNKEVILVLGNQLESFHSTIKVTYENFILGLDLPEEQILLLTSSPNIMEEVRTISKKYNKKEIKCVWCRIYEYTTALQEFFVFKTKSIDKVNKNFNKKFICLNRRWRPQRAAIVALLASKNLLEHGYVSLGECEGGNWNDMYPWLLEINQDNEFKEILSQNKELIQSIPYLYVDTPVLEHNIPEFRTSLTQFYENTYFSIVTETPYYSGKNFDNGIMTSEKIFKAISQRHPFIMLNRPYALKALRSVGYKTFSPFIDESYDEELNDGIRLIKILKETERLCNLSYDEINDFIIGTQKICEHNYNNMVKFIELNFHNKEFLLHTKYSSVLY